MTLRRATLAIACALLISGTGVSARQVRTGPPPEIKQLIDAVVQALNSGSAESWEAVAQGRYAPELLKKQTAAERATEYRRLIDRFGTVAVSRVERAGPDAPLQIHVKGSKSAGVITVDIARAMPPHITNLTVEADAASGGRRRDGVPALPALDRSLTSSEIDTRLDGYFTKLAADDVFSGVALVARDGAPVFFKGYGLADREKKIPNTVRTRFNIGSINKTFTQLAVRQLVRDGKLSLTDTIGKFYPDYPQAASRGATVEQLLTHRGGLSDFFSPEFSRMPKDRFASNADYFRLIGNLPPSFAPGERTQYCNGCYIALGAIVERVTGMPYEQYVAENIFSRAEMTSTGYPRTDRPEADIALGYTRRDGDGTLRNNVALHGVTGSAAGGGYSTALDLLTYAKALRAGRFPDTEPELGAAGGAPGINAVLETRGEWTVIVLTNFDPPTGERIGIAIADALGR